jgi:chromosome segregation ATPase
MTNDDLQQFKKLLEENNKQQDQNFQKRLGAAVDPLHERLDTQYKNLSNQINDVRTELTETRTELSSVEKNLSEKISQQAHDVADILAKAVMPDIDRHEKQITELQKAVGLRPKH